MKKLMTSVIILLPLLILAILLVSGAILSMVTHIYVESVEFVGNGALVLRMEDETAPPAQQLEVNVLPLKAENRDLVYTVENENIATVDENGVVTAKFYGETYVTVTSTENKAATAKRAVVVTDVSVHKLELNEDLRPDLYEGQTQEFSVTVYPKEAANKSVTWYSSDESILHIGANGVATAVGAGDATVTAVSQDDPEVKVSAVIRCHKKLVDLEVDQTLVVTSLKEGSFPAVKPVPADADVTLTYKTSDPSVATVDGSGRISFRKEGRVIVTVTATDFGGKTVEKQKEYTSTDGYFLPPLFAQKQFTVDYDKYQHGEPLPIPFADRLEDSYREFVRAKYTVENILGFDEETKTFRFENPMPAGTKTVKAEITARVYSAEQRALVEYEDYFYLTVLRNTQKIAVSYKETEDAAAITIAEKTLVFAANGESEGAARVTVFPENHTDELSYSLVSGNDVADLSEQGVLSFRSAGNATVRILCKAESKTTAEKTICVLYVPLGAGEKAVAVENGQTEDGTLLLTMESEADKQTGVLYYTEPAGATVEYRVEGDAVTLKETDSARRIVPQKGGFATVKIGVTSEEAKKSYSVRIYVDCPVTADDLTVTLGGKLCADNFGTTAKQVEYLFTVQENNASMAGKKLYVSYQSKKDISDEGSPSHAGTIAFGADLSTLAVTFGVEYGESAEQCGADEERLAAAVRTVTVLRDAESVSVSYNGTNDPASVRTSKKSLTFTTEQDGGSALVNVAVKPANHTNTIVYSVAEGEETASITRQGVLTFLKEGEVKVKIALLAANGSTTAEKTILVAYAPLGATEKEITVSDSVPAPRVLLMMNGTGKDTGVIRFTETEGSTVDYSIEKGGEEVVTLSQKEGVWSILPQSGGFATVKITVTPDADEGKEKKEYTVSVYVDRAVEADDFAIMFSETLCAESFGTTLDKVPFTAEVNGGKGCTAGKKIFVSYGSSHLSGAGEVFSDTIEFPKSLGELSVTFGVEYDEDAEAFGAEDGLSSVTRILQRNAEEIAAVYGGVQTVKMTINSSTVTFTELQSGAAFVTVTVSPATHTDTLSYALGGESEIASLSNGKLTFSAAGTVTVDLRLERDGEVTLQKAVTVTYEPLGENVKTEIGSGSTEPIKETLSMGEDGQSGQESVIYFTEPEGSVVEYNVTEGEDTVVRLEKSENGVWHIVPVGGGFATVTITVSPAAEAHAAARGIAADSPVESAEYTVETYIDLPVKADDFAVTFNGGPCADKFRTSRDSVSYSVTVADKNGSTIGKTLYVLVGGTKKYAEEGVLTLADDRLELTSDSLDLIFGVEYGEKAMTFSPRGGLSSVTRTVTTSRGALDELPEVTYSDGGTSRTLQESANAIEFADIGDKVVFTVKQAFSPADFDFANHHPQVVSSVYVGAEVSADGTTITLKALRPCNGEQMSISLANKTFTLSVTVHAKANRISVECGGKTLGENQYTTLLGTLSFHVTIWRDNTGSDAGIVNDNKEIEYSLDGTGWKKAENGDVTADVAGLAHGKIYFRSADQGAQCEFRIEKVTLEEFGLEFSVGNSEGKNTSFGSIPSFAASAEELSFAVPSGMTGFITVKVLLPETTDYLGGFGTAEEFSNILSVDLGTSGWNAEYQPQVGQIVLDKVAGERNTVKVTCGSKNVDVIFSLLNLARIEFTGFDSDNKVNGGDVYKGYQQVRVFAKQSVYGSDVDYFRMPVQAWASDKEAGQVNVDLSKLTWKLTSYNDKESTHALLTEQTGKTVKYNGEVYSIEVDGTSVTLKKGNTTIVENGKYVAEPRVTWVDPFSEADQGYVRIYFGAFTGLSETDVQNDYFGNFGERENWSMPSESEMYGITGEKVTSSAGAFSYLRLDGGDGALNSKANVHFNFNVLEGSDLYNVFDAAGYYAKNKVVLHNNLYGGKNAAVGETDYNTDEITVTPENKAQFITEATVGKLDKALLIGNGYSVSFNALNAQGVKKGDQGTGAVNVHLQKVINAVVKGSNPVEKLSKYKHIVVMVHEDIYYSDIQYYSKMSPWGAGKNSSGMVRIKNTVLRCATQAALQLYYMASTAYIENVVLNECLGGFTADSKDGTYNVVFNFKGFVDVLNYISYNGLGDSLGYGASLLDMFGFGTYMKQCDEYLEWFGKTPDLTSVANGPWWSSRLANVFLYNRIKPDQKSTLTLKFWNDDTGSYAEEGAMGNGDKVKAVIDATLIDGLQYKFFTYDTLVSLDGGLKTDSSNAYNSRDMSQLFSNRRTIRLLCQYLDIDGTTKTPIKNTDHILWHIQKCYRDPNLITSRIEDHEKALIQSLKDARDSQKWDGEWPDDSTLDQALALSPEAAAMTKLLSETVLPSKYPY